MNLEKDFTSTTLNLKDDYEGLVTATLIQANANLNSQKSILYIHGFVDYFFQADMAEKFVEEGYNFYAIDLRKYGRSILPHQHQNYCKGMQEYYEEITQGIEIIKKFSTQDLYLLGHSTGGLLASNYIINGSLRLNVKALLLNSPFFDLKIPKALTTPLYLFSKVATFFWTYANLPKALSPAYAQSIHKDFHGEWEFNLNFKPIEGFPAYFSWFIAIIEAQKNLLKPQLTLPILIMHSSSSKDINVYEKEVQTVDIVLDIKDIEKVGNQLGNNVSLITIKDALHDIFLSKEEVREVAYAEMFKWLKKH